MSADVTLNDLRGERLHARLADPNRGQATREGVITGALVAFISGAPPTLLDIMDRLATQMTRSHVLPSTLQPQDLEEWLMVHDAVATSINTDLTRGNFKRLNSVEGMEALFDLAVRVRRELVIGDQALGKELTLNQA